MFEGGENCPLFYSGQFILLTLILIFLIIIWCNYIKEIVRYGDQLTITEVYNENHSLIRFAYR